MRQMGGIGVSCSADGITEGLLSTIAEEFPRFRVIYKRDSLGQKLIGGLLAVITLGGQRHYVTDYHTTIGDTVYLAECWDDMSDAERYILMCHERVHLEQFRRYSFLGMSLLYLFVFFPFGLAYFRCRFEQEAYAVTIRERARVYGVQAVTDPQFKAYVIEQFVGPSYGWMWPFYKSVEKWYQKTIDPLVETHAEPLLEEG